ncbi:MAG: permease, partial [Thermoanaerobaculia bacterium]|nr:permease [Thermoanaerobaculia bacterium]
MEPKLVLLLALGVAGAIFVAVWWRRARSEEGGGPPSPLQAAIGFGTNFFDTLGIGSFAPTTALFKLWR